MASNKTKNQIKMPQIKSLIILIIYWLAQIFFSVFYVELHSTAIVQGVVCTCLFSRKKRIFIEGFQFRNFHCKIQFKNIHKSLPTNNWLVWEFKQTNIRKNTSKYSIKKEKRRSSKWEESKTHWHKVKYWNISNRNCEHWCFCLFVGWNWFIRIKREKCQMYYFGVGFLVNFSILLNDKNWLPIFTLDNPKKLRFDH